MRTIGLVMVALTGLAVVYLFIVGAAEFLAAFADAADDEDEGTE